MHFRTILRSLAVATIVGSPAAAQQPQPQMQVEAPKMIANPYGAYEFLIGDWYTKPDGGPDMSIHQQFRWGPNKSYIMYTTYTAERGKPEAVHFEGMAVWNGKTKNLDYVVALEPGSGGQEQGTIHAEPDGSIVRDVSFTGADGRTATFRQRFWKDETGAVATSLMRKTDKGWEPNFPGSEKLAMTRQPATADASR
jgi:hypothetical protein